MLFHILATEEFSFENQEILRETLTEYEGRNQDFSDILIGKTNRPGYYCKATFTLDKGASSLKEFELL